MRKVWVFTDEIMIIFGPYKVWMFWIKNIFKAHIFAIEWIVYLSKPVNISIL